MTESDSPLLVCRSLGKAYGAVNVLRDCSLQFRGGEIHALLGANGAGKSTLVRILAGLVPPTHGTMELCGTAYAPREKKDAEAAGVQIVQQELNLIPTLSVAENLFLNRLPAVCGIVQQRRLRRDARAALDRFGLADVDCDAAVGTLGVGRQQMVEIVTALIRDCRFLILDEPTAALSVAESDKLFAWLRTLRDRGVGMIYISHRLDEVRALADRISILRDGSHVGTWGRDELSGEEILQQMTGDDAVAPHAEQHAASAGRGVALRVEGISGGPVHDVTFAVRKGERLGIAGLVGSGRTELLRLIYGADPADSGHVMIGNDGTPRRFHHPAEAVAHGLAMVTEDRKRDGLLLPQSVRVNTTLAAMWQRFSLCGVIRGAAEDAVVSQMCRELETRCTDTDQRVGTLSGGNQQKVAIARWLVRDAEIFLFDEPTRGIDVAARNRIYRLFDALSDQGRAIIIVSSDLDELFTTCDRIAVMSAGRMTATFARPHWSEEELMQAAFSGYRRREEPHA